jgi:flavin-dependent dehydrogenase
MDSVDLVVVGAGFAGLRCAQRAAERGLRVQVLERLQEPGTRVHTTGLLVQEVIERLAPPRSLVRRIECLRLYAPDLRYVDVEAPGYGFHATDTRGLMRWLAACAAEAGVELRCGTAFADAQRRGGWIELPQQELRTRWLVGADGARSTVARRFGLQENARFLIGVEEEVCGLSLPSDRLHCFLDSRCAPGYFGWLFRGVHGVSQIGLAARVPLRPDLDGMVAKLSGLIDWRLATRVGRRGGLIPVGGPLRRWHAPGVLVAGDAAGLVSPLTAGGIHAAIDHGERIADAIAHQLHEPSFDVVAAVEARNPRFRSGAWLRTAFEHGASDALMDALIGRPWVASLVRRIAYRRAAPAPTDRALRRDAGAWGGGR